MSFLAVEDSSRICSLCLKLPENPVVHFDSSKQIAMHIDRYCMKCIQQVSQKSNHCPTCSHTFTHINDQPTLHFKMERAFSTERSCARVFVSTVSGAVIGLLKSSWSIGAALGALDGTLVHLALSLFKPEKEKILSTSYYVWTATVVGLRECMKLDLDNDGLHLLTSAAMTAATAPLILAVHRFIPYLD